MNIIRPIRTTIIMAKKLSHFRELNVLAIRMQLSEYRCNKDQLNYEKYNRRLVVFSC